jgi:hypothetical protein
VFPVIRDDQHIRHDDTRDGYELNADLGNHWRCDSAVESAEALEHELERTMPDIAARVDVSLGGGSLWIFAQRRDDLEQVRDVIRRGPQPP